jgi:4-hydroxy-tetrahydrodipicolinate synthase
MFKPQGIFTALVTPMHQDETLNEQELRTQVDRQIQEGAAGLFCLGTNGEFYALSLEERIRLVSVLSEQNAGRLPLIVNVGCVTTQETIKLAKESAKRGVDALSIIVPYYAALTQDQLYDHFVAVAQAVDVPTMIYNIPQRTGNAITIKTVARLKKIDTIIGIKDSSGKVDHLDQLLTLVDDDFCLLIGTDSLILSLLQKGASGAVAGCANPFPAILNGIYNAWKRGDTELAQRLQASIVPFRETFAYGNPNSVVKRAVELMGYPVGPARAPARIDDTSVDERIAASIAEVNRIAAGTGA